MKLAIPSGNAEPQALMEVNTTPLIDVMLVLLVMLIITIPMQLHSLQLSYGESNPAVIPARPVVHTVSIDFDGTVFWDDQALNGRAAIDAKMREIGAQAVADQPEVHIKPNRLADYGVVAGVMTSARNHGVEKMGVVEGEWVTR